MKKMIVILAAVMSMVTQSQAVKLGADTQSLALNGGLDFDTAAGLNTQLSVGYGYFIMDYFEVGGVINIQRNDQVTAFGFGPKVEYNFELDIPVVVPFVGSTLTFQHAKITSTTTSFDTDANLLVTSEDSTVKNALNLDVYGGLKFFINDQFAVNLDLVLSGATSDIYVHKDGDTSKFNARVELGLRYYF